VRPIVTTVTPPTASSNGIALSQSRGSAGALTLNGSLASGGVATLSAPGRIGITSAGNDSGITWTITGTARVEQNSIVQSETIAGATAGNTATSTQDFLTVTSIVSSGAAAGNVTAGPTGVGSGPWVVWSQYASDFQVQWSAFLMTGTPTYTVDFTPDDVFGLWLPAGVPFPRAISGAQQVGVNASGGFTNTVRASRLTVLTAGSVQLDQTQQGS
jgi:hypothetical protein